jgi:hypothetical protein
MFTDAEIINTQWFATKKEQKRILKILVIWKSYFNIVKSYQFIII